MAAGRAGYFVAEVGKVGAGLNLITGETAPSQGPLQIGSLTAISPYIQAGIVELSFGIGWATGAGTDSRSAVRGCSTSRGCTSATTKPPIPV